MDVTHKILVIFQNYILAWVLYNKIKSLSSFIILLKIILFHQDNAKIYLNFQSIS